MRTGSPDHLAKVPNTPRSCSRQVTKRIQNRVLFKKEIFLFKESIFLFQNPCSFSYKDVSASCLYVPCPYAHEGWVWL